MKIVLTGSSGNIGKLLAPQLVQKGHQVTVLTSNAARIPDIEAIGAKAEIGKMQDMEFLTKAFSGGVRLIHQNRTEAIDSVKDGILLQAGFDKVTPHVMLKASCWAYDRAETTSGINIIDSRATDISCYHPGYTFVEKLQTITTFPFTTGHSGFFHQSFQHHLKYVVAFPSCKVVVVEQLPFRKVRRQHAPLAARLDQV